MIPVADSSWVLTTYDISSMADGQATVYLRWSLGPTDASTQYCGWNIDDVEIWAIPTSTLPSGFFTEQFGGSVDLVNTSLTYSPDGSPEYYAGCPEAIAALPTNPAGGTPLTLTDDGSAAIVPTTPVSLYGASFATIHVNANGHVTFNSPDGTYSETLAVHFSQPRISALFDDLNPEAGGTISWKELANRVAVTWQNVPETYTVNSNTFQIEMFFDGRIRVSYLGLDVGDGIAGLSEGNGVPQDFVQTDLSAMTACGPRPPAAQDVAVSTVAGTPVTITLAASDDGLPNPPGAFVYIVTSLPTQALRDAGDSHLIAPGDLPYTLIGGGNQLQHSPGAGFSGLDIFTYVANDGGGAPDGGNSEPATVTVSVGGPEVIYDFPMNVNPGWTTQGTWEFGQPDGLWGRPSTGHTGNNVYAYDLNGEYTDNMPVYRLTTTPLDCTGVLNVELRFWRWLGVESAAYDSADLQVSNNGTAWTTIWNHTGLSFEDTTWTQWVFDISAVADDQPTVYVRWRMGPTDGSVTYFGWNIDDVEIWGLAASTTVPGDLDDDGDVDDIDLGIFVAILIGAETDPGLVAAADMNGDLSTDGMDIQLFTEAYVAL